MPDWTRWPPPFGYCYEVLLHGTATSRPDYVISCWPVAGSHVDRPIRGALLVGALPLGQLVDRGCTCIYTFRGSTRTYLYLYIAATIQ